MSPSSEKTYFPITAANYFNDALLDPGQKSSDYVTRGLKATIHNDNTSAEARESAAYRLEERGEELPPDYYKMKEQGIGGHEEIRGEPKLLSSRRNRFIRIV